MSFADLSSLDDSQKHLAYAGADTDTDTNVDFYANTCNYDNTHGYIDSENECNVSLTAQSKSNDDESKAAKSYTKAESITDIPGGNGFDLILCNPPYSSEREKSRLSLSHRTHEPSLAIFSPDGPLSSYRTIAQAFNCCFDDTTEKQSPSLSPSLSSTSTPISSPTFQSSSSIFRPGSHLVLEIGHGQEKDVLSVFQSVKHLRYERSCKDHNGLVRCLVFAFVDIL